MMKWLLLLAIALFTLVTLGHCQTPAPVPAKKAVPAKKVAPAPAPAPVQQAKPQSPTNELTVDQVCQLVQAKLSEDLIVTKIKKNNKAFDLDTEQLLQLKKTGASDNIIRLLMDPTAQPVAALAVVAPAAPAPPAVETTTAPRVTAVPAQPKEQDPAISRVPEQAGLYYLNGPELVKIDLKTLASAKAAGRFGHMVSLGIKSIKTNAYLIGPSARTRVKETSPTFYVRLPENYSIDELVLVSLYAKPDRRELEVSAQKGAVGAKQGLRMEVMKPFETQELGSRLYKIATNIIGKGEYLFYLVGSADSIKGIQGKGYDFGIE